MSPTVAARGVELAWDRSGGSGAGPTLVWGHGLTSSRAGEDDAALVDWPMVRHHHDVVRYDARGHGESGFSPDLAGYGWADLAGDQLVLADALDIRRHVSGGASMGAATALHAAVRAPSRVDGLILAIPPTAWETRAAQADQYETMASIIETRGVEWLISAGAQAPTPDPFAGDPAYRHRREAALRAADPVRLAGVLRGAAHADLPAKAVVATIAVPTLILAWTGDPGHPVSTAEVLDELIADTTCHVARTAADVAGWGHLVVEFMDSITR